MNTTVVQNAIGGLDKTLGKAKDALRQIDAEAHGYDEYIGYEDAEGALEYFLDGLGHTLSIVLEAAEMPAARTSLKEAWERFKKQPCGLKRTTGALDGVVSRPLTYAERLIEALRMCVSNEITSEEAWILNRLELLLQDTAALVHDRGVTPAKEQDIQVIMKDYLRVSFPGFDPNPKVPGTIKHFKPDCGIRSVSAAIEFKMVHDKHEVARALSGIVEDSAGYRSSKEWTRFYAVIFQAKPFSLGLHWHDEMKRIGATPWKVILVNGDTKPKRAKTKSLARSSSKRS